MPSSFRRRCIRQLTGVNINRVSFSVEGGLTVWVRDTTVNRGCTHRPLKARKGAERSCRSSRRRKRGLRRGKSRGRKRRSRGCHPRRSSPQAATDSNAVPRCIRHKLRMLEWNTSLSRRFSSSLVRLHRRGLFIPYPTGYDSRGRLSPRVGWKRAEARWECLHNHLLSKGRTGERRLNANSALGHSFVSFVESYCKLKVKTGKGIISGPDSFDALLHRANLPRAPPKSTDVGNRPDVHRGALRALRDQRRQGGTMCRRCGEFTVGGGECPTCYAKAHGSALKSGRSGGATPMPKDFKSLW